MAAGLTLGRPEQLPLFEKALEEAVAAFAPDESLFTNQLITDGPLAADHHDLELVRALDQLIWGQGFPRPLFRNRFRIFSQQRLKDRHLRLGLQLPQSPAHRFQAIWFDAPETLPPEVELAYELQINDWQGHQSSPDPDRRSVLKPARMLGLQSVEPEEVYGRRISQSVRPAVNRPPDPRQRPPEVSLTSMRSQNN
jgi:hypothetical protein